MVKLSTIRKSNAQLQSLPPGIVAVFAGATSGIGLGTLKQFAKCANGPKAYIIGRSHEKGRHIVDQLKLLNPMGSFTFIEAQMSRIAEVDRVCEEIMKLESHVDILCMSMGYQSLGGRVDTPEGIETNLALQLYSRLRLVINLLPHLEKSMSPRIISVLCAGYESKLNLADLDNKSIKHYSVLGAAYHAATMMTLLFEHLAKDHPTVSFIHSYPGAVATNIVDNMLSSAPGMIWYPAQVPRYTLLPLMMTFGAMSPSEAGERTLFLATSARFPPAEDHNSARKMGGWVDRPEGVCIAASTVVKEGRGNGVYRVKSDGETWKETELLQDYRRRDVGSHVWDHMQTVFADALEKHVQTQNGN
ncbi:hypothetical protein BGZ60DRAFT_432476 [Tricladium varicosporioides]|nr:hypothetical protein BGZ60DRAFT_432476 [Hymenoscyphus varicosporioides]